jgi:hypothetical protein
MDINFNIEKESCNFFLKKNGKIIKKYYYSNYSYNDYLCISNNFKQVGLIQFPKLYGKNENEIIKKLLILNYVQKRDMKYIEIKKNIDSDENKSIYCFNDENKDIALTIYFFQKYKYLNISTMIKSLTLSYILLKLVYNNLTNSKIFINIFYSTYLNNIKEEINKKFNKKLKDFSNFNNLYIFLKEKGYVDKFYNFYKPKVIKNYKKMYNELINNPKLIPFKKNKLKNIKNFRDIDLLELVDKYVNNNFNKIYIKNKFIELSQKI